MGMGCIARKRRYCCLGPDCSNVPIKPIAAKAWVNKFSLAILFCKDLGFAIVFAFNELC